MATRIAVLISSSEYDEFVRLMPADDRLPQTYDKWQAQAVRDNEQCISRGDTLTTVEVHSNEFQAYCHSIGQSPNYYLLEAFAVKKDAQPTR